MGLTQHEIAVKFRPGAVLKVIAKDGILCEPETLQTSMYHRMAYHGSPHKIKPNLVSGSIVLCLEHHVNDGTGTRIMRIFSNNKFYTYIGYYLPQELFEPLSDGSTLTPCKTDQP